MTNIDHDKTIENIVEKDYEFGFQTSIETEKFPKGLNEDVIRRISAKKKEPDYMLEFRLKAFKHWQKMEEPHWSQCKYDPIDYQDVHYYAAPKSLEDKPKSLDDIDPELKRTFDKLGIPLIEQKQLAGVAVDAVFDSVSVATTYKEKLKQHGVIFCSISEAIIDYPDLVKKYLGSVVPFTDNFYACLNSAAFTDGSFVYVPKGVNAQWNFQLTLE